MEQQVDEINPTFHNHYKFRCLIPMKKTEQLQKSGLLNFNKVASAYYKKLKIPETHTHQ